MPLNYEYHSIASAVLDQGSLTACRTDVVEYNTAAVPLTAERAAGTPESVEGTIVHWLEG